MTSFMPPAMTNSGIFLTFASLVQLFDNMNVLATKNSRLILDLADNGGGMVDLANLLLLMVSPEDDTKADL
eukprot:3071733-Amphidinium_carterae.1